MSKQKIAKDLLGVVKDLMAGPMEFDRLPKQEQEVAEKMMEKGYTYAVQITTTEGDFGAPVYFKSANEVGPLLRSFPDYLNAKTKWVIKLAE